MPRLLVDESSSRTLTCFCCARDNWAWLGDERGRRERASGFRRDGEPGERAGEPPAPSVEGAIVNREDGKLAIRNHNAMAIGRMTPAEFAEWKCERDAQSEGAAPGARARVGARAARARVQFGEKSLR